ncbi:hypothetical protein MPER_02368 [Moniliophthora perniciosa FA553]|nr:hypothetical protein MPER_02368 [Moniliophthora perniciosa FA553]
MHNKTKGYLGNDNRVPYGDGRVYSLEDLVGPESKYKFRKHSIPPGCTSIPIIDKNNVVIGVLASPPQDDGTWQDAIRSAAGALEAEREKIWFEDKRLVHKRGEFPVQPHGYSFGGGQQCPKRIFHTAKNKKALDDLTSLECFKHLAGHANGDTLQWAPNIYR